jgi:hypothetical protein
MMGRDHALSGAFVFAALATTLHVNDAHLAAGVALCAGAGVLPDIDHQDTSVSSSFGFLTEGFSRLVAFLSGGHRHGTHSIFGIAVFTAGSYFAGLYQLSGPKLTGIAHPVFSWHLVPAILFMSLLYSAALRALHVGGHHGDLLGIGAAVITCYTGADLTRLAVGSWHVPASMREFHLLPRPLQFTTAKLCETWVVFPLLVVGLGVAVWHDMGHPLIVPSTPGQHAASRS